MTNVKKLIGHYAKFALIVLMVVFLLVSCTEQPDMPSNSENKFHTTGIRSPFDIAEYGDYIYYSNPSVYRYDRKSGVVSAGCNNSECDGNCPLDDILSAVSYATDGKMYFYSVSSQRGTSAYSYLDLITNNVTIFYEGSMYEDASGTKPIVLNEFVYYVYKKLKTNGDSKNADDYISTVCRVAITGGNEEVVCQLDGDNEHLVGVMPQYLITYDRPNINIYDISTGVKRVLFDSSLNGYVAAYNFTFLNGKLYFCATSTETVYSEYRKTEFSKPYMISLDVDSGEFRRVIEEPVFNFCLAEDKAYYTKFELRHLYVPDDYETNPGKTKILLVGDTLYCCDHNGENSSKVFAKSNMDFSLTYTVIENKFYGLISDYDTDSNTFGKYYFACIDPETGDVIPAITEN